MTAVYARSAKIREIVKVAMLVVLMDAVGALATIIILVTTPTHPVYLVPVSAGTYAPSCPTTAPTVVAAR